MADRSYLEQLTRKLTDEGKLIEAGWVAMRIIAVPPDATATQLDAMRYAFMAGAQHLFSSIMAMLEPGVMETPDDLRRMDLINTELEAFGEQLKLRISQPKGQA